MLRKIGFIVLLTALSGAASAGGTCKYLFGIFPYDCTSSGGGGGGEGGRGVRGGPTAAPEIDLGSTAAGLTLALGGLVVLRGRRARSPK
jgi:hypothetical protein